MNSERNTSHRGERVLDSAMGVECMTRAYGLAVALFLLGMVVGRASADGMPSHANPKIQSTRDDAQTYRDVDESLDVRTSSIQALTFSVRPDSNVATTIVVDGKPWSVELQKHSIRSPSFQVWIQDASGELVAVEAPTPQTYVGTVVEVPGSEVRASYRDGQIKAIVYTSEGTYGIEPIPASVIAAEKGEHAVFRHSDWVNRRGFACGAEPNTHGILAAAALELPLGEAPVIASSLTYRVAQIALDADYEFFQLNSSNVNATVLDMESVMNGLAAIYESQLGITYDISSVVVRTTDADPYSATSPSTLLGQLVSHWNSSPQSTVARDTVHLFTGKNLDGSVIGIAYIGAICHPTYAYGLSQSRFTSSLTARVALTAHELGHNWNAQHCNACATCTDCCRIMCSGIGGCSGMLTSFGCQEVSQMSAFRDTRSCLGTTSAPDCSTSGDCDDGLYCNGIEICQNGSCVAGAPPNCADAVSCTTDACSESARQCIHTPNDAVCDDGLFCNGTELCSAGSGCVAGTHPCGASACDETTDQCLTSSSGRLWISFADSTVVPGVGTVQNEDIVAYDLGTGTWSLVFDGSDLGLINFSIDGLAQLPSGDVLLSFSSAGAIPFLNGGPAGSWVDDSDVIRFVPTSLGTTTLGSFVFYFDGSDVGLSTDDEDVDAIALASDGRLVVSTLGPYTVNGLSGYDKDLIVFNHLNLGSATSGSFARYFDGNIAGLSTSVEDVDAAAIMPDGNILLSTLGSVSVPGVTAENEDILQFTRTLPPPATAGSYSIFLDLTAIGFSTYVNLNALELAR